MAPLVVVLIYGFDGQRPHGHPERRALDEHIHLILIAVAAHGDHGGQEIAVKAAQARLRVPHPAAVEELKDHGGDPVSHAAFGRYVLLGEIAAPQQQARGVPREVPGHAQHVLDGMLAVAVGGDDDVLPGTFLQHVRHALLERHPFPAVGLIADDMADPVLGDLRENALKGFSAAIVHNDDLSDTGFLERPYIGWQPVVRLVGGNYHGGASCAGLV